MTDRAPASSLKSAASLVVFRNGTPAPEILMIRRSAQLAFGGGLTAFPGGRVDPEDVIMARALPGDPDWNIARVAAIRETFEETGLLVGIDRKIDANAASRMRTAMLGGRSLADLLDREGLALVPEALVPFSRWHPPEDATRRFDTRFFLTDIGTGNITLCADGSEITDLVWLSASEAIDRSEQGALGLMFPTRANLMQLARFGDFTEARADCLSRTIGTIVGTIENRGGEDWLTIGEEHGFPDVAQRLNRATRI